MGAFSEVIISVQLQVAGVTRQISSKFKVEILGKEKITK